MKEPVDHILRPTLPWRSAPAVTECGYDASKVKTLTRDEFKARLTELGKQRTAMMTCMTCISTARDHGTWDDDPRSALAREVKWEWGYGRATGRGDSLRHELLAIAELIARHESEFSGLVEEVREREAWLARKDQKPKRQQAGKWTRIK